MGNRKLNIEFNLLYILSGGYTQSAKSLLIISGDSRSTKYIIKKFIVFINLLSSINFLGVINLIKLAYIFVSKPRTFGQLR